MKAKEIIQDKDRLAAAFLGLLELQNKENADGEFEVSLLYDNYHDGAYITQAGEVVGNCYDILEDGEEDEFYLSQAQCVIAIERALAAKKLIR